MPTFTERVNSGLNNGYWAGSWFNSPSTMNLGNGSLGTVYGAWRFTGVTIPQGAIITAASLQIAADSNNSANLNILLYGIAEDNTADFTSDPGGRTKTTHNVAWNINTQTANTVYTSPDLTAVIQEIVNRAGWSSGNALGLITANNGTPVGTFQSKWAFNGNAALAGFLTITYTSATTTNTITIPLKYTVKSTKNIQKLLRYFVYEETTNKPFTGMKVSKAPHDVLKTTLADNLKFSSDYNTLKYLLNGQQSILVNHPAFTLYTDIAVVNHNLGYYPLALVYAIDDLLPHYEPLGHTQIGSGAYRQFYFYVTTTQLVVVANGYTGTLAGANYTVNFYYKIFANNLNI